jgi:hypothetical protein
MFVNSDFSDLLKLFNAEEVRYLVIGGYALIHYTEPRYTKNLDLWIDTDALNAEAVYKALQEFGAPLEGLSTADFTQEDTFYQMGVPPMRVDILMGKLGVEFDHAWESRVEIDFDDLRVPFISRKDLIATKRAAGRPQDLLDVKMLSAAKNRE